MRTVTFDETEYQILLHAITEAIDAQSFYLQNCRDPQDKRTDEEIEESRALFEMLLDTVIK